MTRAVDRRRFLFRSGTALLFAAGGGLLGACRQHEPLLRVAMHPWPGYELIHLARTQQYFSNDAIRLVETPSATASLRALASGTVEAACITLDEVLTARADGIDLVVVAVLDVSLGADALVARPPLASLQQLKGRRIGAEQTALGAVMLDAILRRSGLRASDLQLVDLPANAHHAAYMRNEIDALITFEPVSSQLVQAGARVLFSSAEIPGHIVDVLAVQRDALDTHPDALRALLAAHFRVREEFLAQPQRLAPLMADRLQLDAAGLTRALAGLELTSIEQNQDWLGRNARLLAQATHLESVMRAAGLLPNRVSLARLADARFLPQPPRS